MLATKNDNWFYFYIYGIISHMKSESSKFGVILNLIYIILVIVFTVQLLKTPTANQNKPQVLAAATQTYEPSKFLNTPESEVFNLVNKMRSEHGLRQLKVNPYLVNIAKSRAEDIALSGDYSHKNPDGKYYYNLLGNDYDHVFSCENLELEFSVDTQLFVNRWITSDKHRNCLLSPDTTDIGYALKEMKLNKSSATTDAYILVAINSASPKP